jgi:lysyl-tRNA synthetase class 2
VTALLAFDVGIHLFHYSQRIPTTVVALLEIVALLYFRNEFYAEGDHRNRWRALRTFVGLVVADVVIGLTYILLAKGLEENYSLSTRVWEVITGLVGVSGPVQWTPEARGDLFNILTSALGIFTLIVTAYLFLRPAEPRARLGRADADRVRELLAKHGDRDSLGYFALRNDKSVIWSPTGKACICYRVVSGVMLASGDPIGDPEAWPGAIGPFLDEAARHAWAPAVMGCSELGAEVWCREGDLTALELGDEAIVNIADFSLSGRSMRNVRQMVNRVAKNGYVAEVRRVGDIPRPELDAIVKAADSWRGSQTERGFSMALGRIGANGDDQCVLVTAKENGAVRAVLQLVPWGADGLSLDLMQRDKGAQPGLNDFLIVETIKAASGLGVKRISLNFAVFRAALERGERIGAGPVLKAWRSVLIFMSKWFQIESLYKFNAKFCPVWQPRFFVFPSSRDAPRIALAALQAEAFLVRPQVELNRIARRIARKLGLAKLRRRWQARQTSTPRKAPLAPP